MHRVRIELAVAVAQPLITTVPVAMASFAGPTGKWLPQDRWPFGQQNRRRWLRPVLNPIRSHAPRSRAHRGDHITTPMRS